MLFGRFLLTIKIKKGGESTKKLQTSIAFLLVLLLFVSVVACGTAENSIPQDSTSQSQSSEADSTSSIDESVSRDDTSEYYSFGKVSATGIDEPIPQDDASQSYSSEDVSVTSIDEPVSQGDADQSQSGELPETSFVITCYHDMAYNTVGQKTVADCDLAYTILDSLRSLQETGETAPRLGDDIVVDSNTHDLLPVDNGTMWLECGSIGLFRYSGADDICKVQTHLGEGKQLIMTDSLKTLLHHAWYYYPFDCWNGKFQDGALTLDHVYSSASAIDSVRVESMTENSISLYLLSNEDREDVSISLECQQSNDFLGQGDYKTIQLKKGQETHVELSFEFGDYKYGFEIIIFVAETRVSIWLYP